MRVVTMEHEWIKMTETPVSVLSDDDGEPVVFVDPEQAEIAEDHAVYGCRVCGEAMATHHNKPCPGEDNDD